MAASPVRNTGTTGTSFSSASTDTPWRNLAMLRLVERVPSGKMIRLQPWSSSQRG
tara:strand:+ start:2555 stop:2719 length:165 start_codon:yes stop_codon:yes gene_type:complete